MVILRIYKIKGYNIFHYVYSDIVLFYVYSCINLTIDIKVCMYACKYKDLGVPPDYFVHIQYRYYKVFSFFLTFRTRWIVF